MSVQCDFHEKNAMLLAGLWVPLVVGLCCVHTPHPQSDVIDLGPDAQILI